MKNNSILFLKEIFEIFNFKNIKFLHYKIQTSFTLDALVVIKFTSWPNDANASHILTI